MATFEILTINTIPHLHVDLTMDELKSFIADPFAFILANPSSTSVPIVAGRPVTWDIFTYATADGLTSSPNVCDGTSPNGPGHACVCTPVSIVASANHFRAYFKR